MLVSLLTHDMQMTNRVPRHTLKSEWWSIVVAKSLLFLESIQTFTMGFYKIFRCQSRLQLRPLVHSTLQESLQVGLSWAGWYHCLSKIRFTKSWNLSLDKHVRLVHSDIWEYIVALSSSITATRPLHVRYTCIIIYPIVGRGGVLVIASDSQSGEPGIEFSSCRFEAPRCYSSLNCINRRQCSTLYNTLTALSCGMLLYFLQVHEYLATVRGGNVN